MATGFYLSAPADIRKHYAPSLVEEKRQLRRELNRKDKALAEMAALLTLSKKAQAIWGKKRTQDNSLRSPPSC